MFKDYIRGKKDETKTKTVKILTNDLGSDGKIKDLWDSSGSTNDNSSRDWKKWYLGDWESTIWENPQKTKLRPTIVNLTTVRNLQKTIHRWVNQKGLDPTFLITTKERSYRVKNGGTGKFVVITEIINIPNGFTVPSRIDDLEEKDLENYLISDICDSIKWIKKI